MNRRHAAPNSGTVLAEPVCEGFEAHAEGEERCKKIEGANVMTNWGAMSAEAEPGVTMKDRRDNVFKNGNGARAPGPGKFEPSKHIGK